MKDYIYSASDIRQSPAWGKYLESIGWKTISFGDNLVYIKTLKFINRSIVKIQHPKGRLNLQKLEKELKKYKPLYIIVEPHIFGFEEKDYLDSDFNKSSWRVAPSATIKLDLTQSEDHIFKSFSENARRNIKKAEKNNLQIKIINLKQDKNMKSFEIYFDLLSKLRKQKGFYAPGREESINKMNAFKNNSVLLFAYHDNQPIATVWLGIYDKTITYMQTGISPLGYKLLANYLLVWEGIKWGKKHNNVVFDFESIYDARNPRENKNWIGFSEFKKRFHGEIIYYPSTYIRYYSLFFKLLGKLPR